MNDFFYALFKYVVILIISGLVFSFIPKLTYTQVGKLLLYHNYKEEILKKRFIKVLRVYLILGISLGFVFAFLLSPNLASGTNDLSTTSLIQNKLELFGLSFGMSFLLVIILRISTLLNKTNILIKIVPAGYKNKLQKLSEEYDYEGLREEISGFLFSIFLSALLGLIIWFSYNVLFKPQSLINFSFEITNLTLLHYVLFILGFMAFFVLITFIAELILHWVGVHPKCLDRE